jgi:hypothetical protein
LKPAHTAILLTALAIACADGTGSVEIYLAHSPLVEEAPLDPALVTHIRIRVSGAGMKPQEKTFQFEPGGSATLSDIPTGRDRVITVEGLAGEAGYAISRGRTAPMRIRESHQVVDLFIARVGRFSFTPGYGLNQARFAHAAALAPDGRLFIVGGATGGSFTDPTGLLTSIEVYDPTSGGIDYHTCSETSGTLCLETPRAHAAAAAVDERLFLVGGRGPDGPLDTGDLIDTDKLEIDQGALTSAPRVAPVLVTTGQDQFIVGGLDAAGDPVDTVESLDPDGQISVATLPGPRSGMAGSQGGAHGLIFGGVDETGALADTFLVYNPAEGGFSEYPATVAPRAWASVVSLSDGRVIVIGGQGENGEARDDVDLYDHGLGLLCHIGRLKRGRYLATGVRLGDGRVLVVGGLTGPAPGSPTAETELIDPRFVRVENGCDTVSGELSTYRVPNMRIGRYGASAFLLANGDVAVVGGLDQTHRPIKQIEIFVPDE